MACPLPATMAVLCDRSSWSRGQGVGANKHLKSTGKMVCPGLLSISCAEPGARDTAGLRRGGPGAGSFPSQVSGEGTPVSRALSSQSSPVSGSKLSPGGPASQQLPLSTCPQDSCRWRGDVCRAGKGASGEGRVGQSRCRGPWNPRAAGEGARLCSVFPPRRLSVTSLQCGPGRRMVALGRVHEERYTQLSDERLRFID